VAYFMPKDGSWSHSTNLPPDNVLIHYFLTCLLFVHMCQLPANDAQNIQGEVFNLQACRIKSILHLNLVASSKRFSSFSWTSKGPQGKQKGYKRALKLLGSFGAKKLLEGRDNAVSHYVVAIPLYDLQLLTARTCSAHSLKPVSRPENVEQTNSTTKINAKLCGLYRKNCSGAFLPSKETLLLSTSRAF
jgi:hypothetical protein